MKSAIMILLSSASALTLRDEQSSLEDAIRRATASVPTSFDQTAGTGLTKPLNNIIGKALEDYTGPSREKEAAYAEYLSQFPLTMGGFADFYANEWLWKALYLEGDIYHATSDWQSEFRDHFQNNLNNWLQA